MQRRACHGVSYLLAYVANQATAANMSGEALYREGLLL